MFVMTNDGGPVSGNQARAAPALCQRAFIFDVMARSIPIALLRGAVFRDSKVESDLSPGAQTSDSSFTQIITFIFEQGLLLDSRKILGSKFWACVEEISKHLDMQERQSNGGSSIFPLRPRRKESSSREPLWTHFQETVSRAKYPGLLWCFVLHCEVLPLIPLQNRTIGSQRSNRELDTHLRESFLPELFSLLDSYLSEWNIDLDIDGNIFTALLGILLSDTTSLPQQLGDTMSRIAISIELPSDDLLHLRSKFPAQLSCSKPRPLAPTLKKLLPFHHDVFDHEFSLVNLSSNDSEDTIEYGALEFGRDTAFNDKYHWHNPKRHILPKHLGGEQTKATDEWQRMKMMRRHQQFMSRLTINAATLTGALGVRFNRLTIITGGTDETQGKRSRHVVCFIFVLLPDKGLMLNISQVKENKKPGKKEKPMSSKEKLLAEIAAKKLKQDTNEQQGWWEGQLKTLSGSNLDKNLRTLTALEQNPRTAKGWLRDEVLLYRLHLTILKWAAQVNDQDTDPVRDHYTVVIMRIVKELSESSQLTPTIHQAISAVLTVLGFESFVTPPDGLQLDRPLCFKFVKLIRSKTGRSLYEFMRITEDPVTWQLRLFGEFMDRSMGSKPDPRVSFAPDAWQLNVLDCLDRNESIFVVGRYTRRVS